MQLKYLRYGAAVPSVSLKARVSLNAWVSGTREPGDSGGREFTQHRHAGWGWCEVTAP
jgi:hypothetical protein